MHLPASATTNRIVIDRDTGKPKGYGFCEFYDRATAESAYRNLNGTEVAGRALRIDFAEGPTRAGHRGMVDANSNTCSACNLHDAKMTPLADEFGPPDRRGGPRGGREVRRTCVTHRLDAVVVAVLGVLLMHQQCTP